MSALNDQFVDAIRGLIPINGLPDQHQNEVIRRGRVVKFRKGRYIFKQGEKDHFSFYLIEGELELIADGQLVKQVSAGTADARHALAQLQPRQLSARAKTPLHVFKIDRTMLDRLLADDRFDDGASLVEVEELSEDAGGGDWMTRMLGSDLFSRLPASNIQTIFTRMEAVDASAGDVVVEQGSPGDYYYIIQSGRCLVTRRSPANGEVVKLAELNEGDSFGEEALVSDSRRNATVTMLTDGQLMRLAKTDFNELIKKPTLSSVTYAQATKLVAQGAVWLDVRFADEHKATGIKGSVNLPLNALRTKMAELDSERRYVVYCDSGGRSSAGAFLLAQRGYDASYLAGGLIHSPIGASHAGVPAASPAAPARGNGQAGAPTPAQARVPAPPPAVRSPPRAAPPAAGVVSRDELAAIKRQLDEALRLKAEAEKARAELESAMEARLKAETDRANVAIKESQRLKREILEAKRQAQDNHGNQGNRGNGSEQGVLDQRHIEAERRLREEKRRLETALEQTARELKDVSRKRDQAEARLREEKQALEARSRETERRLQQAERLKREAESARRAAEARMEDSLRSSRERIEADDRRAEQAIAELERLKRDAEEARRAVETERRQKEAREAELQNQRQSTEVHLRGEQQRLEQEQQRQRAQLAELHGMREQAEREIREQREALRKESEEAARRMAEAKRREEEIEVARREAGLSVERKREELRALEERLRADEKTMMERVKQTLSEERRRLEAELAGSREALARAQQMARQAAEQERRAAEQEAERIIAEYKQAHEMVLADELAKLQAERAQLEAEAERAKRTLAEAQRLRREAEDTRRGAEQRIAELRAAKDQAGREQSRLLSKVRELEAEVERANRELRATEHMSQVAQAAHDATAAELERQREQEQRLQAELENERDRVIDPRKLAELRRQRAELERAAQGRRK